MPNKTPCTFRLSSKTIKLLNGIVAWERSKGLTLYPYAQPNRTTVLEALVERESLRLDEEAAKTASQIASVKQEALELLDRMEKPAKGKRKRNPVRKPLTISAKKP